jgi:hypothetical protein
MTPPQTLDNRQYKCNRAANSKALNSPHLLQKQVPNILKCRNVRGNESEREEGLLRPEPACRSLCEHYYNSHCVHDSKADQSPEDNVRCPFCGHPRGLAFKHQGKHNAGATQTEGEPIGMQRNQRQHRSQQGEFISKDAMRKQYSCSNTYH